MSMTEKNPEPKVFITQFISNLNYSGTDHYGEAIFLTKGEFRPEPSMPKYNESIANEIKNNMGAYLQGIDYIVLTGSSIPNMVVGTIISKMKGSHKLLKWSNREKRYEVFTLTI